MRINYHCINDAMTIRTCHHYELRVSLIAIFRYNFFSAHLCQDVCVQRIHRIEKKEENDLMDTCILGTFTAFALTSLTKSHRCTNFIVFVHASMYSDKLSSRESVPLFT